jgi:hypothetical protein
MGRLKEKAEELVVKISEFRSMLEDEILSEEAYSNNYYDELKSLNIKLLEMQYELKKV